MKRLRHKLSKVKHFGIRVIEKVKRPWFPTECGVCPEARSLCMEQTVTGGGPKHSKPEKEEVVSDVDTFINEGVNVLGSTSNDDDE